MSVTSLIRMAIAASATAESQNFLGARWVRWVLTFLPRGLSRPLALRFLAASPHYFYRNERNASLRTQQFLEGEYQRNRESRELIINTVVAPYLRPDSVCLDYGCGPGFLAVAAAPLVDQIFACDISDGVLACARIINASPKVYYMKVEKGRLPIKDESVDVAYSIAVFQHVTDAVLQSILSEFRRVMKPGASAVCHVVIDGEGWRSESDWRADRTMKGRLKWEIGLHCFSRSADALKMLVANSGFEIIQIARICDLHGDLAGDDVSKQHLCVFRRPS